MNTSAKSALVAAGCVIASLSVSFVAPMAQAEPVRVTVSDIDLNTAQGMARFNERVAHVANQMCESYPRLSGYDECVAAVVGEAKDNLNDAIQLAKAKAQSQTAGADKPSQTAGADTASPIMLASKNP
jgi:UrcA family protein